MLNFSVIGTPISQGSKSAWVPCARNADINDAIYALRDVPGTPEVVRQALAVADRLEAVGKWPIFMPAKDPTKNGRWLANLRESSDKKLKPWRKAIAKAAREAWIAAGDPPMMTWGVRVEVVYWFRRPLNHYRTGRFAKVLKPTAPGEREHDQKPDRDKLDRAVMDALTQSGIWDDDKRNTGGGSWKRWRDSRDEKEGCEVTIF